MDTEVLADSFVAYPAELSIFSRPIQILGVTGKQTVTCYPVNDYTTQGPIQFCLAAHNSQYIDLKHIRLNVTAKIVKHKDNGALEPPADNKGSCGVVANFLHSMFSRVDVSLQSKLLTHSDNNYPYLAYLKALLYTTDGEKSKLDAQLFYPDTPGEFNGLEWKTSSNAGYKQRSKFFGLSREVDMSGNLACDVLDMGRYLPAGIPIEIKLHRSSPEFCLLSPDDNLATSLGYKVIITKASLDVPKINVSPEILVAHDEVLGKSPAIYPYTRTEIKKHNIVKGAHDTEVNNPFSGRIPSEVIVGLVKDSAHHGSYESSPFEFKTAGLSSINLSVDSFDVNGGTVKVDFSDKAEKSSYLEAYKTLIGVNGVDDTVPVTRLGFYGGYSFYRFVIQPETGGNDNVLPLKQRGNVRLFMTFKSAVTEPMTIVMLAKFPAAIEIDKTRCVREV